MDLGYFVLLFGDEGQPQQALVLEQLLRLEPDEAHHSLALGATEVRELRVLLDAKTPPETSDPHLMEEVTCCREDLKHWLDAHGHAVDSITVTRHC